MSTAPFRTTVCGLDELANPGEPHPTHVLSILDPEWPVPEAFGTYGEHEKLELRFHDQIDPMPGQILPEEHHVAAVLQFGRDLLAEQRTDGHLLVHCHAGISRSTASMALILAQGMKSLSATEIMDLVLQIREKAWPNLRIIEMGDRMLGRDGTLVEAAHAVYRQQLVKRPFLWDFMSNAGRGRELATGTKPTGPTERRQP